MNGKNYYSNLKPYEIVVKHYAPDNNNPEHRPAGASRIQKRKWKVWYHVNNEFSPTEVVATYVRAGRKNEWILSSGGASCPSNIAQYENHFILGRKNIVVPQSTIYGWDLSALVPYMGQTLSFRFGEQNFVGVYNYDITINTLQDIVDYFTINIITPNYIPGYSLSLQGDTMILSRSGTGAEPYPIQSFLIGAYDNNSGVFVLPNDIDGYLSYISSIIVPSTSSLGDCEVVEVKDGLFDCSTDNVLFIKNNNSVTLSGTFLGRSNPEGVNWADVAMWDNRTWTVWFDELDTDGLGAVHTTPYTFAFTSFSNLIGELNNQLQGYGSSFRLLGGLAGNRIFLTDLSGNVLSSSDTYLSDHNYVATSIVIEDSIGKTFLVKGLGPDNVTVIDVVIGETVGGLYRGTIGCAGGSSLPVPKIMLDNSIIDADIQTVDGDQNMTIYSAPVVITQDLSQSQISQGVKLEFMYYRPTKRGRKQVKTGSRKGGFVHPSQTYDDTGLAVYTNDSTRGGKHNGILGVSRPSEFSVTNNGEKIPLRMALGGRLKKAQCWYRDSLGVLRGVLIPTPVRRVTKYKTNIISDRAFYNSVFAPLYFKCRYAIRKSDGTWESGPESGVMTLAPKQHPFIYDPVASANLGIECGNLNPLYNIQHLKVFNGSNRLPT